MEVHRGSGSRRIAVIDPCPTKSLAGAGCRPDSSKSSCSNRKTLSRSASANGPDTALGCDRSCECPTPSNQQQQRLQQQQQQHKPKHQHRRHQSHKFRHNSPVNGRESQIVGSVRSGDMVAFRQQRQPEQQKKQQQMQQQKQQQKRGDASARRKESLSHAATNGEATHDSASSSPATVEKTAAAAGAGCEGLEGNLHWIPFEFSCGDFDASSPYVPVALLGRGAVGRVFRCTERSSGDSVAVKVVSKHLLRSRSRLRRQVLMEKEALVALSGGGRSVHPSVVHLRRTYQTADSLYFVLRYAGAATLRDVLRRLSCAGLSLSVGAARLWAAEAAAALAAMRGRGVLHRDIRPENIVVNHDGHLTLVDFDSALCLAKAEQQQQQQQPLQQHRRQQKQQQQPQPQKQHQQQQQQQQQHRGGDTNWHRVQQHPQMMYPQQVQVAERLIISGSSSEFFYSSSSCNNSSSSSTSISRSSRNRCESEPGRLRDDLESLCSWQGSTVKYPYAGTAAYAPPELFVSLDAEGEEAAQQQFGCGFGTDCWSLGCVVHELLLGEPPFNGHSTPALARAVYGEQELPLPQQLPAAAADLIRRLLRPKEEERLGSRDLSELLEHPFFNGVDCMALHYHPLPLDVMQYAFAFQGTWNAGGTAGAAAAVGCGVASSGGDETDTAAAAVTAAVAAAVSAAALDAELTPSIGCPFSPLKSAAADAAHVCVCCDSSKTCMCCGGDPDAIPTSPGRSGSSSSTGDNAFAALRAARKWKRTSSGCFTDGAGTQEHSVSGLREESEVISLQSESTEELRGACRRSVTDAVLGWGPPLRLWPVSSADYSEADSDISVRKLQGAAARYGGDAGVKGSVLAAAVAGGSMPPPETLQSSAQTSANFRDSQWRRRGPSVASHDAPSCVAKCLQKGEKLQYHGVLLRMREHRSFCERLFFRVFGRGHKRNCQLQPQRCLGVLTDTGRLLLMDPNGRTLRKTVLLATDGEIYTEGKDMLIYSSAKDNCYLLFASEENTVSLWARSLAASIESLRCKGAYLGSQSAALGQPKKTDMEATMPVEPSSEDKFVSALVSRAQDREAVDSSPVDEFVGSLGGPSGGTPPAEPAFVPTRATFTGRPNRDRSNCVSHGQKQPTRWRQERLRCRRGSAMLASTPATAREGRLRRPQSEGPHVRYRSYRSGTYDLKPKTWGIVGG